MKFANSREAEDYLKSRPHCKIKGVGGEKEVEVEDSLPKHLKMTNAEMEYQHRLSLEYPGCVIQFEPVTFHLLNGHSYTPDFSVRQPEGRILLVEVKSRGKNGFRLPSYQRAKVMFDQCKLEWPIFEWRFAEKYQGEWDV